MDTCDLAPFYCPFCNSGNLETMIDERFGGQRVYIHCCDCEASGPVVSSTKGNNESRHTALWNKANADHLMDGLACANNLLSQAVEAIGYLDLNKNARNVLSNTTDEKERAKLHVDIICRERWVGDLYTRIGQYLDEMGVEHE